MKRAVNVIATIIVIILAVIFQLTMQGKDANAEELNNNLDTAVESTVDNMLKSQNYSVATKNEFIADFIQNLSVNLDADSDITVKVLKADPEKGLLSIRVIAKYKHPNGSTGSYESTKTVLFEKITDTEKVKSKYVISFYRSKADMDAGSAAYKAYELTEGDALIQPVISLSGKTFQSWKDSTGNTVDFTRPVTGNASYYAVFN